MASVTMPENPFCLLSAASIFSFFQISSGIWMVVFLQPYYHLYGYKAIKNARSGVAASPKMKKAAFGSLFHFLGRKGSNLRMAESKSAALPLGYGPICIALRPMTSDRINLPERPQPMPQHRRKPLQVGRRNRALGHRVERGA